MLPGIEDLLDDLRARHVRIGLATAKPRPQAVTTLEHFGLAPRFDVVAGSRADAHSMPKSEIVADALAQLGHPDPAEVVMVGDRHHDIEAAHANGVDRDRRAVGLRPCRRARSRRRRTTWSRPSTSCG